MPRFLSQTYVSVFVGGLPGACELFDAGRREPAGVDAVGVVMVPKQLFAQNDLKVAQSLEPPSPPRPPRQANAVLRPRSRRPSPASSGRPDPDRDPCARPGEPLGEPVTDTLMHRNKWKLGRQRLHAHRRSAVGAHARAARRRLKAPATDRPAASEPRQDILESGADRRSRTFRVIHTARGMIANQACVVAKKKRIRMRGTNGSRPKSRSST